MPINFKRDVIEGLKNDRKSLSSKYFYDEKGDALFQQIMQLDEYYLPECEKEIIEKETNNLAEELLSISSQWNIIELGAGDGTKTLELLKGFEHHGISINYIPLDISANVLQINEQHITQELPDISYESVAGNYYRTFYTVARRYSHNLILYLGSNIGNYSNDKAIKFLQWLRHAMTGNDLALVAFDLKKHPNDILRAYNDCKGVTRAFNLNLLERINRELGADFMLEKFDHYPYYEPVSGAAYSYIVSLEDQKVTINGECIHFAKHELIHTEISKKYSLSEIETLSAAGGFGVKEHLLDHREYYSITMLEPHD